jgi:hypothetical protein
MFKLGDLVYDKIHCVYAYVVETNRARAKLLYVSGDLDGYSEWVYHYWSEDTLPIIGNIFKGTGNLYVFSF